MTPVSTIFGMTDLAAVIARKANALSSIDFSPILPDVGEIGVLDSVRRIQSMKVGPDGTPWQPWSAAYARSGRGASLERKSGHLMGLVDSFVSGSDEVTLYADSVYAARQQFGFYGTDSAGRSVSHPARPYLGLSDAATREVGDVVARHIVKSFNEAAL